VRRLALMGTLVAVIAALAVAQLVLPGIAAQRLRAQLARSGQVISVQVSAFPAVELLWHRADSVTIRLRSYRAATGASLGGALAQSGDVGSLTASAGVVRAGLLTLRDATLVKRGGALRASATVAQADLRAAVPLLQSVTPIASGDGTLTLRGTASLLGISASVDATLSIVHGALVVAPDVPFGGLAAVSVFSDPRIAVQSVAASAISGGFELRGTAQLS
jgi:hypothetical protein